MVSVCDGRYVIADAVPGRPSAELDRMRSDGFTLNRHTGASRYPARVRAKP